MLVRMMNGVMGFKALEVGVMVSREVEDFERILNSDWPERMQEILSLGRERKPINGNGSLSRDVSCFTVPLLTYNCFRFHCDTHYCCA
ncbi:hypothetical protein CK203_012846 [Vitis vinifera]|uniref:Uncharacterized protein n=1 Tax=Vitis vinifera TaxID=29760 RepID=A0A438JLV8_VITVI|nr:hypothetical protein CK203_012846 [Vitis vinifera]